MSFSHGDVSMMDLSQDYGHGFPTRLISPIIVFICGLFVSRDGPLMS